MLVIFAALTPSTLQNELSIVQDKWYKIGIGLGVPTEQLEKFVGLSNPLLEVIVHWLKGTRHPPASWETVFSILQHPDINEAKLAEKIQRLYIDKHEEKTKIHQRRACSGTLLLLMVSLFIAAVISSLHSCHFKS